MPRGDESDPGKIDIADEFAKELTDHTADKIKVHYAGNFPAGIDWRKELIPTIQKSDMFILLYTGAEQQWEFCLLEAGLFQATHPERPLIVMHDPATPRPEALSHLNAISVTVEHMADFLTPIFYDDPWKISPNMRRETLIEIATDLVRVFHSVSPFYTNFDLVPSFTLEMGASDGTLKSLRSGKIPLNTKIRGTHDWQVLFDKDASAQNIKWNDLKTWPVKQFYDLKFSRMASAALNKNTPGGCFIRPSASNKNGTLYRVALRRYEEYANETGWRFFFTAAPIDIPIFGIGDNNGSEEIMAYHLLNVCWYTRRCLILDLFVEAEKYFGSASAHEDLRNNLVERIKDELVSIDIQSFIRRIDHPKVLAHILPLGEIEKDQEEWIRNKSIINNYRKGSKEDFNKVVKSLRVMKVMNDKYYSASALEFSRCVTGASVAANGVVSGPQ